MKDTLTDTQSLTWPAQDFEGNETPAMTQQGFKRFRRRKGRTQGEPEQPSVPDGRVEPGTSPDRPSPKPKARPSDKTQHQSGFSGRPETQDKPEVRGAADGLRTGPVSQQQLPAPLPEMWERIHRVPMDMRSHQVARSPLVNFFRSSPTAKAFDLLRTRLLHSLKAHGWKRVAIASPTAGCGATFTAVNLALSLARVPNTRTILMDMNFRRPAVAATLRLPAAGDMRGFLSGELSMPEHLVRPAESLAVGLTAAPDRNAAEILHDPTCAQVLDDMTLTTGADVILFDLPPVLEHDDVAAFLPQVDGVLLVADGTRTTAAHLAACEQMFKGQTQLLGVSLNRARGAGLLQHGQ